MLLTFPVSRRSFQERAGDLATLGCACTPPPAHTHTHAALQQVAAPPHQHHRACARTCERGAPPIEMPREGGADLKFNLCC